MREGWTSITICSDTTWFIRCHLHAFASLGGVPKRLLYDTLKSVVLWRDAEGGVHWNPRFLDFADVAGFSPQARPPISTANQRQSRERREICAGQRAFRACIFGTWTISMRHSLSWLNTTANRRVHGTTGEVPFTRLPSEGLQPADKALSYDTSLLTTRRRSKDCFISSGGNLSSVPAAYACKTLQVKITEAEELVICSEGGDVLARHRILFGRQERSVQTEQYRGLGTPSSRIERRLPCMS
jgi:hypothetical protein